jgi:hypothetical protein
MVGQISGVLSRCEDRGLLIFMIEDFLDRALEAARRALGETEPADGEAA